jgi:hypothetical protein
MRHDRVFEWRARRAGRRRDARECFAHSINLCEVYYDALRVADEATANQAVSDLIAAGVIERNEMDPALWR